MFRYLAFITFLFIHIFVTASSQSHHCNTDSLKTILQEPNSTPAQKLFYARQLAACAVETNDNAALTLSYKYMGNAFQISGNADSAVFYYTRCIDLAKKNKFNKIEASATFNLSMIYNETGNYKKALTFSLRSLEMDKAGGDEKNIASSLNSVAIVYMNLSMFDKATDYQLQSIKLYEKINDTLGAANAYLNLGIICDKIDNLTDAKLYFRHSSDLYEALLSLNKIQAVYSGYSKALYAMARIHKKQGYYLDAEKYYKQAIEIQETYNDKSGLSMSYIELGNLNISRDEPQKAIDEYKKSLNLKQELGDRQGIAILHNNLGSIFLQLNNYSEAERYLSSSLTVARLINDKAVQTECLKKLSALYEAKNDNTRALQYYKEYTNLNNTVYNESSRKIIEEMRVKFDTDKKEKENLILSQENTIQKLDLAQQKNIRNFLLGILALVIIIVVVVVNQMRIKRKANAVISKQNEDLKKNNIAIAKQKQEIEEKNRDITDSIQYARRIQEAMLADIDKINKHIPDLFILFKPRDIVSGDFYWFAEKNNKKIIAAVDCTGHGVPGAFMSMIGDSFLDQIVNNEAILSPDRILLALDSLVRDALKQNNTDNKDGMDITVCVIDEQNKTLEFSGAKNPLIIIKDKEITKIKGSRDAIGGNSETDKQFEKHTVSLKDKCSFYIFSDGFQDQFGADNKGKFKPKRFFSLLSDISDKPHSEQRDILDKTITTWMGDEEQIDDILVIGFTPNLTNGK